MGLYHIERLFPRDLSYFMAIKLDFPNEADKASMKKGKPFPAVSIRGGCQITGSIHLGTDAIQEAYLPAMEAWAQGGKDIPVYLFPARLTPERSASLAKDLKDKRQKARLEQLTTAFARFDSTHRPLKVSFSPKGEYVVE